MAITRVTAVGSFAGGTNPYTAPAYAAGAGNLQVVALRAGVPVTDITDTAGNLYRQLIPAVANGGITMNYWATWNSLAHASNVVSVAFSGTPATVGICVAQYSGIDPRPWDLTTYRSGATSGNTITTPAFSTAYADSLILSFGQVSATGQTWTANGGATKFFSAAASDVVMGMEKIVSSIQTGTTASADCASTTELVLITAVFAGTQSSGGGSASSYPFVG